MLSISLDPRPRASRAASLLGAVIGALGVCGALIACGADGDARATASAAAIEVVPSPPLRIATFNVGFVPHTPGRATNPYGCGGCVDEICRAGQIADRILATRYDVIALNEVFDEDARDVLVSRLRDEYPYRVEKLGGGVIANDSGLMLLSRLPFVAPAVDKCMADGPRAFAGGAEWTKVGFRSYDACDGIDCFADKGAGYVRIADPRTGDLYNVVFSHLQASYGEDDHDLVVKKHQQRREQLAAAADLVACVTTPEQLDREHLFVMGDLNIDGDLGVANFGDDPAHDHHNRWEYDQAFAPGSLLPWFSTVVRDQWADTTSPEDRGLSESFDERLDYVLRNAPTSANVRLCTQHLALGYHLMTEGPSYPTALGEGGTCGLSDHLSVSADLAPWAPRCSPVEAAVDPTPEVWHAGAIAHPGNVQWYRVNAPGTYSIGLDDPGVRYRVYEATDLSRPIASYHELSRVLPSDAVLTEYAPRGPFYIEVFAPDPTWTGSYQLMIHRHDCTSELDACVLYPDAPRSARMDAPWYEANTMWFRIDLDRADSGKPQRVAVTLDGVATGDLSLSLRHPGPATPLDDAPTAPRPDGSFAATITRADGVLDGQPVLVQVRRSDTAPTDLRIGWHTNLTILHGLSARVPDARPLSLKCVKQQEVSEDEIWLDWRIDGVLPGGWSGGNYDDEEVKSFESAIGTVKFVEQIEFTVTEIDDVYNESATATIRTLDVEAPGVVHASDRRLSFDLNPGESGGIYELTYNLSATSR